MAILKSKEISVLFFGAMLALTVACDKKSDSSPTPAAPAAPTYNYVNGACHDMTTNAPVAINLCANVVINGNYRFNGSACTDLNGTPVAQNLCAPVVGANTIANGYRWNGSQCVDINNAPVATTFCSVGASAYRWNGIACIDFNGVAVSPDLCASAGQYQLRNGECYSGYTWAPYSMCAKVPGYVAGQCNGTYIKYSENRSGSIYYTYTKYCYGNSCSGETLLEYYSRRPVVCP